MKNKTSLAINCIFSFVISVCLIWCMTSSFDVKTNPVIIGVSSLIFTGLFSAVSIFAQSRNKFLMSIAVIFIVFIFTTLFSLEEILSDVNYYINCILNFYSGAIDFPKSVNFSSKTSYYADVFFVFLGFVLSAVNTISLIRIKSVLPVTIEILMCLIPCFVLVNTLPSLVPLITVISLLLSMYITSFFRKYNFNQYGFVLIVVTSIMLVIAIAICNIFPLKNYERYEWQNNLLEHAENILGITKSSSDNNDIINVISDTEKLSEIGPLKQKGEKTLKILTEHSGKIYLKKIAFANYNNNEWTTLTNEQAQNYPTDFNAFTMTDSNESEESISIVTESKEEAMYTPYFTADTPDSLKYDVFVKNQYKLLSYNFDYIPFSQNNEYYSLNHTQYNDFVWSVYLELPKDTKESMLKIAEKNGLTEYVYNDIPKAVKEFVSSHAYYSLDTSKMPEGEDFPVWFLNEAESGYCVHYATAAAVMLRTLGVPARYVTGYYVNATANEWTTVTSDNAHAWVEYYDNDRGWIPLEATPASFSPVDYEDTQEATAESTANTTVETNENTTTDESITSTQSVTEPAQTVASTKPSAENSDNNSNKSAVSKTVIAVFAIVGLILALIITLAIRYAVIIKIRKNHFKTGRSNQRAICIYRYIKNINKFSNNFIPDNITEIAQKAKFSNHSISCDEINLLTEFAEKTKENLYNNSSALRKLYLRYIKLI